MENRHPLVDETPVLFSWRLQVFDPFCSPRDLNFLLDWAQVAWNFARAEVVAFLFAQPNKNIVVLEELPDTLITVRYIR